MPSEKIAIRRRLPPVKVLMKPRNESACEFMKASSAAGSMPGVGIAQPMR